MWFSLPGRTRAPVAQNKLLAVWSPVRFGGIGNETLPTSGEDTLRKGFLRRH